MSTKHSTTENASFRRPSFLKSCASRKALYVMLLLLAVLALGGCCKSRTAAPPNEPNESQEPNVPADVPRDLAPAPAVCNDLTSDPLVVFHRQHPPRPPV